MSELYNISSSPHIRAKDTSAKIMLYVIIALLPASIFGVYNFGLRALLLIAVCIATCVASEWIFEKIVHKKSTITDFSAVLTGLLLALNLPYTLPIWQAVLGSVFAIVIVKMLFGGLGQNFMNPALGARCFLLVSFASTMTSFTYDGVTGATPLALMRNGESVDTMKMFLGTTAGTIGETSVIALLIGAVFLILMGVIDLRIPGSYLITFVVFLLIFSGKGFDVNYNRTIIIRWSNAWSIFHGNRLCHITDHTKRKDHLWYPVGYPDRIIPPVRCKCRRCIVCNHLRQPLSADH